MIKKVKWTWDWGCYMPLCPYCNEYAYEKDYCVFCEKEYEWVNKSKERIVSVGDYTIVQASNNHIQIYKGDRAVMHIPCTNKLSRRKLKEYFCKNFREKGADNEQRETD